MQGADPPRFCPAAKRAIPKGLCLDRLARIGDAPQDCREGCEHRSGRPGCTHSLQGRPRISGRRHPLGPPPCSHERSKGAHECHECHQKRRAHRLLTGELDPPSVVHTRRFGVPRGTLLATLAVDAGKEKD